MVTVDDMSAVPTREAPFKEPYSTCSEVIGLRFVTEDPVPTSVYLGAILTLFLLENTDPTEDLIEL